MAPNFIAGGNWYFYFLVNVLQWCQKIAISLQKAIFKDFYLTELWISIFVNQRYERIDHLCSSTKTNLKIWGLYQLKYFNDDAKDLQFPTSSSLEKNLPFVKSFEYILN